jgi:hypothetical protein
VLVAEAEPGDVARLADGSGEGMSDRKYNGVVERCSRMKRGEIQYYAL